MSMRLRNLCCFPKLLSIQRSPVWLWLAVEKIYTIGTYYKQPTYRNEIRKTAWPGNFRSGICDGKYKALEGEKGNGMGKVMVI